MTICQVEFGNKKRFVKIGLNKNIEIFVVYMVFYNLRSKMLMYSNRKALITFLLTEKVTILVKYSDFFNIFLEKFIAILLEKTIINKHIIYLEVDK